MKYQDTIRTTKTLFVDAKDLEGMKGGVIFANSTPSGPGVTVLFDGRIDYMEKLAHYDHRTIERYRKQGKFLIVYKGSVYRYAYTREV